jgi:hypothetical protein
VRTQKGGAGVDIRVAHGRADIFGVPVGVQGRHGESWELERSVQGERRRPGGAGRLILSAEVEARCRCSVRYRLRAGAMFPPAESPTTNTSSGLKPQIEEVHISARCIQQRRWKCTTFLVGLHSRQSILERERALDP